ncbi:MAG TPA: DHA2 family efflux MFS transporter permease subunit [Solirubrobacteraceae bacterium]|jgi:EmrB/QacA subfamily drug resistance transporter|nr:DHA2 family efflux MFS transporter permease subunit [Solirubrobacteraceae bacterium]
MQRKTWTLIAVCLATFMLLLDITIVNVALPDIKTDLDASFSDVQWVVDAYALMLAALLLTAGSLADLLGRRRVFVFGVACFSVASLLCALSSGALTLILARGAQGIGGAAMFATSLALLAQEFHGRERGTAFGIWGATTGAAVAIGPLVGGALTSALGWPSIFYLNLPIGVATIVMTLRHVPDSRDEEASGIDWAGLVTFSAALLLLVFALIQGNDKGWASTQIVGMLVGAAVLLVAFLVIERRQARPMFDLELFRKRTFSGVSIAAFALSASMFAMFLYITLYVQTILGYGPLATGLRFLPLTVLSFFAAAAAGKLTARLPARAMLCAGLVLVGIGLLLMDTLHAGSDWTALLPGFIVSGLGIGLTNPSLANAAIGVVAPARSGMASGINSTFRQVGIATGIAGLGAIFQTQLAHRLTDSLAGTPGAGRADELAHAVSAGGGPSVIASAPAAARPALKHAVDAAFSGGLDDLFLVGAVIAFAGALLALALVRRSDFVVHGAPPVAAEPAAAA